MIRAKQSKLSRNGPFDVLRELVLPPSCFPLPAPPVPFHSASRLSLFFRLTVVLQRTTAKLWVCRLTLSIPD